MTLMTALFVSKHVATKNPHQTGLKKDKTYHLFTEL